MKGGFRFATEADTAALFARGGGASAEAPLACFGSPAAAPENVFGGTAATADATAFEAGFKMTGAAEEAPDRCLVLVEAAAESLFCRLLWRAEESPLCRLLSPDRRRLLSAEAGLRLLPDLDCGGSGASCCGGEGEARLRRLASASRCLRWCFSLANRTLSNAFAASCSSASNLRSASRNLSSFLCCRSCRNNAACKSVGCPRRGLRLLCRLDAITESLQTPAGWLGWIRVSTGLCS